MEKQYDLIVIGAGPGGYVAAVRAAQRGLKTAVVEAGEAGGTCLNKGCIPTKIFMHAAEVFSELKNCETFGIYADHIRYDLTDMQARKDVVIGQLRAGIERLFKVHKIDLISGHGQILAPGVVGVGEATYTTDKILLAVGSKPSRLPIPGLELPQVLTSDDLLGKELVMCERLTIIGGGVIGVEFASIYQALGAKVTIIEAMERILPGLDKEISQNLGMILKKRGIEIYTGAAVQAVETAADGVVCHFEQKGARQTVAGDHILVSVGRRPNTEGLVKAGLDLMLERGQIPVDANFATAIPGVYAIGDAVKGTIQLAHMASAQALNVVAAMQGQTPPINLAVVPSCIYTSPEIAAVGLTQEVAKAQGIPVKTGKFVMSANGKTMIVGGERGFIKVLFHAETEVILGAQMMCARATDMIGELSSAIVNGLTVKQLAAVIRPHPTFAEGIQEAIEDVEGQAIHIVRK